MNYYEGFKGLAKSTVLQVYVILLTDIVKMPNLEEKRPCCRGYHNIISRETPVSERWRFALPLFKWIKSSVAFREEPLAFSVPAVGISGHAKILSHAILIITETDEIMGKDGKGRRIT